MTVKPFKPQVPRAWLGKWPIKHTERSRLIQQATALPQSQADAIVEQARVMELALERSEGKPVEVPFAADDVGGQLVAIVSSGLYSDPRDCIREYAQNAVDAGATRIDIRLQGFNVQIEDNGSGMTLPDLIQARQFGMSTKDRDRDVGFRGIGVYAGFPICDSARIVTHVPGSTIEYTMYFDFDWMRQTIQEQRKNGPVSLAFLMQHGTRISFQTIPHAPAGKTVVYLDNLSSNAYHDLSDWTDLEKYIVGILPVGYDEHFAHSAYLEEQLRKKVPGYRSVNVHVTNADSGDAGLLRRRFPIELGLTKPRFWEVVRKEENRSEKVVAVVWASWAKNRKIRHESAGLLYKLKGFTIGDGQLARRLLTRSSLYNWFIGEIWVLDPELVPNAGRSDFEASASKRKLGEELGAQVIRELTRIAEALSKTSVTAQKLEDAEEFVKATRAAIAETGPEQAESARASAYAHLRAVERVDIKKAELVEFKTKHRQTISALKTIISDLGLIISPLATSGTVNKEKTGDVASDAPRESSATMPTATTFAAAGWKVSGAMQRAFEVIDRALVSTADESFRERFQRALLLLLDEKG